VRAGCPAFPGGVRGRLAAVARTAAECGFFRNRAAEGMAKEGPRLFGRLRTSAMLRHSLRRGESYLSAEQPGAGQRIRAGALHQDGKQVWATSSGKSEIPPDAFVSHGPVYTNRRWRAALRAGLRWRPGVPGNGERKIRWQKSLRTDFGGIQAVGLCRIAAGRWGRGGVTPAARRPPSWR